MIRTFIAVELPHSMKELIESIQQEMDLKGLKLVKPELVHLTLKFLGDITESQVEPISTALSEIHCTPFNSRIAGVGVFPNPSYIKVVWLGAHGEFDLLHSEVERVLKEFRFKKDKGKFTAHATLARVKYLDESSKSQIAHILAKLQDVDLGELQVKTITLKKSTLTPKGPIYETLKEIPLHE
ncbi:MAG: RNA 2',3'-cyclic phosphodiesterase [Methanosarcinales archaeon]|nr:RNA 2',3'-cyclic phosphodiesterase [Methanosarcinales archaeon]